MPNVICVFTRTSRAMIPWPAGPTLENGVMRLTANNPEQEEAVEEIELDYSGETVETGYNITYLIDAARVISSEDMELHLQGNDGICIIKQPDDSRSTWLIMPMRI